MYIKLHNSFIKLPPSCLLATRIILSFFSLVLLNYNVDWCRLFVCKCDWRSLICVCWDQVEIGEGKNHEDQQHTCIDVKNSSMVHSGIVYIHSMLSWQLLAWISLLIPSKAWELEASNQPSIEFHVSKCIFVLQIFKKTYLDQQFLDGFWWLSTHSQPVLGTLKVEVD